MKKKEKEIETVGDMIDALKKLDRKLPIKMSHFVDRSPNYGCNNCWSGDTDMSGNEEFSIKVYDLESRVVIEAKD